MKITLPFAPSLFFLFLPGSLIAVPDKKDPGKQPADGIYLIHEKGNGPKVTRNDTGDQLVLGERLTAKFGAATIHATNNGNTRFRLDLAGAGPLPQAQLGGSLAILIGGRCFMIYSRSDPQNDGTRNFSSVIHGEEAVKVVAAALKAVPVLRKHPGHKFAVTFEPDKESYRPGAPIMLTMTIKNVGDQTVCFHDGGRQRGPRDNQFGFTAMRGGGWGKPVPDTGDPTNFGGMGSYRTLKQGDVFQKKVSLDKWFQFKDADTYLINATYRLEFHEPNAKSYRVIWDDFATAECTVRIEAPKK
jgi:hypothetical protein